MITFEVDDKAVYEKIAHIGIYIEYFNALPNLRDTIVKKIRMTLHSAQHKLPGFKSSAVTGNVKEVYSMMERLKNGLNSQDNQSSLNDSKYNFKVTINNENDLNKLEQIIG